MSELAAFRAEFTAWLDQHFERRDPNRDDDRVDIINRTPDGHHRLVERARDLQQALYRAGFAGMDLPVEYGGRGLTRDHAKLVEQELAGYDTPTLRPLAIGMHLAAATLIAAGSEQQKQRFLPALIRGDEQWCQMFSEPDAGSDLVSLRTRAVLDGEFWVVDGQKVWSSYAADADYGLLLARTDPDAPKPHVGITMLICDMHAPGVTVRPLVDIAGGQHFNEVFLEHVEIPVDRVIGAVNSGWGISAGTLSGERSGYMGGSGGGRRRRQVIDAACAAGRLDDPLVRQRAADVIIAERLLEWVRDRFVGGSLCGGNPAAGSMLKVAAGSLEQQCAELIYEITGIAAQAWDRADRDGDIPSHGINATRQARIAGGTHEIQRNLLGERILGLPR